MLLTLLALLALSSAAAVATATTRCAAEACRRPAVAVTRCRLVALLEAYRVESPCAPSAAAMLVGESVAAASDAGALDHWVAVYPNAVETSLVEVGAPAAIGRLRSLGSGGFVLDQCRSSIPKEQPAAAKTIGLVVDALLLAWLAHVDSSDASFEQLAASATPFTAPILEKRGFAEVEHPDFSALARNEPIATHSARLPAACVAYAYLQSRPDGLSVVDLSSFQRILDGLRQQPPPPGAVADAEVSDVDAADADADDPWAAMRRRAGYDS